MFVTVATILHADLDAFYASVEQRDDPRLRGRPVIVGGGVVLACSYEAKRLGVRTAMGGHRALRLCPHAIVVPPRMEAYSAASKAVFEVFRNTTPLVEGISIDEAFLEVGGLRKISGTPLEIAERLRRDVLEQVGLPITVGIARTKFLAMVPPDGELEFLHPLPVERLWGVGRVTAEKLHSRGVYTVGDVGKLARSSLVGMLGKASGRHLHALAHNYDPRPVRVGQRRRSIGSQRALGSRPRTREDLEATLAALVDRTSRRLRAAKRVCRTVVLRLRFADFDRATRSHTLFRSTDDTQVLLDTARTLLRDVMGLLDERGCTLVGISLANLDNADAVQLVLPFDHFPTGSLDTALDLVRDKYGSSSVTRAVLLGRDPGIQVPMLPD
jgi:DNA polymerase-4